MKNKVLVKLIVPSIEEEFDLYLPLNKSIGKIIELLKRSLPEVTSNRFVSNDFFNLYDRNSGNRYELNDALINTNIRNGSILVLI